jgi:hypothetical protein
MELEGYWRAFTGPTSPILGATEATLLENRALPILELNAAYPTATGQLLEIEKNLAARDRPACLILPEGSSLELEASKAQFVALTRFVMLECANTPEPDWTQLPMVEQVGWGSANVLARIWCQEVDAPEWQQTVTNELARLMPNQPNLRAFVALEADQHLGMGLALAGDVHWIAGEARAVKAIAKRVAFESGEASRFSVPFAAKELFMEFRELQRNLVWIKP